MWSSVFIFSVATILNIDRVFSRKPELGNAINMFQSYGTLAENMRVFKGNVEPKGIYFGPDVNIFKPHLESTFSFEKWPAVVVSLHIHIQYCAHFNDLVKDYFAGFKIAGIANTPLAFSRDWSKLAIARLFGLTENFIDEGYSYMVLKVKRSRDSENLDTSFGSLDLNENFATKLRSVTNDITSAERFIDEFGTHYISSYTTGDFVYQVFVFKPPIFRHFKEYISSKTIYGLGDFERKTIFSPQLAVQVGQILSASGNQSLETWAAENLQGWRTKYTVNPYSSLIRLYLNETLSRHLDKYLENSVIFEMELETMSSLFDNPERRQMFDQHIRQRLKTVEAH